MSGRREVRQGDNTRNVGIEPGQIAREVVAALAEANLLSQAPRASTGSRNFEVVREFLCLNPPKFHGNSGDHLGAYHWLSEVCKCLDVLAITEDSMRVRLVTYQLGGEAHEWWKSVLEEHRDARRAAMTAHQMNELNVEDLPWEEFERLFKNQYCPESCRGHPREKRGVRSWEPPGQVRDVSLSLGAIGDSNRKRQRELPQHTLGQSSYRPPVSSGMKGISVKSGVKCFKCKQPGHIRSQCTRPPKSCHRCNQLGHLERNCPQRAGRPS